jgi:WD40 repeat protein
MELNFMKILLCLLGLALMAGRVIGQSQSTTNVSAVRQVEQTLKPDFAITNAKSAGPGIIAYNPNGHFLAVAGGKSIQIFDVLPGDGRAVNLMRTLDGHTEQILGLAFSDTNTLVSVSLDKTAKIWEVASGKIIHSAEVQVSKGAAFALQPGRDSLAADSSLGKARLWNYQTGGVLKTFEPGDSGASAVAFTPNGKSLVIGTEKGVLRVMDVAAWTARTIDLDSPILSLAASAEHIVVGYFDGTVAILDYGDQTSVPEVKKQSGAINALAFSPNGGQFASASADHSIKVWDTATLKPVYSLEGHGAPVTAVVFRPEGNKIASMDTEGVVNFWALKR